MLTSKLQSFVEHYTGDCGGNGSKAAEAVGCSKTSAKVSASRWLKRLDVQEAIHARAALVANHSLTATLTEEQRGEVVDVVGRKVILSRIMLTGKEENVIRASEVLNKMEGVYIEKHEHAIVPLTRVIHEDADV